MAGKGKSVVATGATPSYLKALESQGPALLDDNFGSEDVTLPRIALLQGMSETVKEFDEAQQGMFWHLGMDLELDPLRFIPVVRRKRVLLVAPLDDGQGILARADDARTWDRTGEWTVVLDKRTKRTATWTIGDLDVARSGLLNWGTQDPDVDGCPPAATVFYDYVVLLPDYPELGLAVISLARSAIKKAKQGLNDKIPMQALVFQANVVEESSDFGSFYNWQFRSGGFAHEALYDKATAMAERLADFKVQDETGTRDRSDETGDEAHEDI